MRACTPSSPFLRCLPRPTDRRARAARHALRSITLVVGTVAVPTPRGRASPAAREGGGGRSRARRPTRPRQRWLSAEAGPDGRGRGGVGGRRRDGREDAGRRARRSFLAAEERWLPKRAKAGWRSGPASSLAAMAVGGEPTENGRIIGGTDTSASLFSNSRVSSALSPSPPVQTGKAVCLNAFSWTPLAPNTVEAATVNDTAGTLCGRSRGSGHRTGVRLSNTGHRCAPWMR